jgi:hypothetical protein
VPQRGQNAAEGQKAVKEDRGPLSRQRATEGTEGHKGEGRIEVEGRSGIEGCSEGGQRDVEGTESRRVGIGP